MKKKNKQLLRNMKCGTVVILMAMTFSCSLQPEFRKNEKEKITKTIHACVGWAKNKDFRVLYSIIANDSTYLEVDPGERVIKGFEEFRKNEQFWGSPDFRAIRYDIRDLEITFSDSGKTAWFYCLLDDINEWKGQPANWENTRWTGVLENRKGQWVIVQQHFSFASE